jgi:hypothetical protein
VGQVCTGTSLAQSLVRADRTAEGLPGYFYSVQTEPAYPVAIGLQEFKRTDPYYFSDATSVAQRLIRAYIGQEVQVVLDDQGVTITPAVEGVTAQRLTNAFGLIAIELDIVVQIYQQYAGRIQQGTHYMTILTTRSEGQIIELQTEPLDRSKYPSDTLVATMESIFQTLQLSG